MIADSNYKHPTSSGQEFLGDYMLSLLERFLYGRKQKMVLGDFNLKLLILIKILIKKLPKLLMKFILIHSYHI